MASDKKVLLYVAIDFGTTYSGYAFRFALAKEIRVNQNWGKGVGHQSYKVPTCVLTDDKDNFVAFGYEAQTLMTSNTEKQKREEIHTDSGSDIDWSSSSESSDDSDNEEPYRILHYYDEFKMMLQGEKMIDSHMKLKAFDGHRCEASKIFAMALKYLKDHLMDNIQKETETTAKKDEIKWVLTVPAIWSDGAKQFMRKCAVQADIVDSESSDQLLIALEPEAASLYCRTLDMKDFNLKENITQSTPAKGLPEKTHYMVVDCGGGTVDVTAHNYKKGGDICELYAASGGGWGGRNINKAFEDKLNEIFGEQFMNTFRKRFSAAYLDTKINFEKTKRGINFSKTELKFNFDCPHVFNKICTKTKNQTVPEVVTEHKSKHGVGFSNGKLIFDKSALVNIFSPSIDDIKNHILELVDTEELKELKYIYLVGGFSDCALLQSEIKNEFTKGDRKEKQIHVILAPYEASLAVVKGAVLFGNNPDAISSRCARRFYCTVSGNGRGKRPLTPIVRQNEEIYNDDVRHTHFIPSTDDTIFKLYHFRNEGLSKSKTPKKYSTDIGMGVIEVDLSNIIGSKSSKDAKISIYLYFGSTEIHVTARNDKAPGMKQVTQSINCLNH